MAGSDSDLLAGLVQATATVAAVLVGYLLSILAERRAWQRRKAEQIRERRLQALIDFIDSTSAGIEWLGTAESRLDEMAQVDMQTSTSAAAREAMMTGARLSMDSLLDELTQVRREATRRLVALRILQLPTDATDVASQCVDLLRQTHARMAEDLPVQATSAQHVVATRHRLEALLEVLTKRAVSAMDEADEQAS